MDTETKSRTIAETITEQFPCGQTFQDAQGRELEEVLKEAAHKVYKHSGCHNRQSAVLYEMYDESYIVINDQFWDVLTLSECCLLDSNGDVYVNIDEDGDPLWGLEVER